MKFILELFNLTFLHYLNTCNLFIELACDRLFDNLTDYEFVYICF